MMYFIEFFADKTPRVDSGWDAIHTFIRIPAGALLAAGAASGVDVSQSAELAAALVGGTVAAGSHFTKSGSRLLINTSPEPVTNWTASIAEDLAVIGALWAALNYPLAFLAMFIIFVALFIWLMPKLWRVLKNLYQRISAFFSGSEKPSQTNMNEDRSETLKSLFHAASNADNRNHKLD
jgi:CBS domain containing-hemolysin-like protein